ncbi:MAG: alpha-glucosidase C-terminal domain-containing protein [Bacteroidales bacterium]|nr:MAG: alpha-glucosidase C-terminal domain-containing protein [Bacteroidales bacterium]
MKKLTGFIIIAVIISTCFIASRCRNAVEIREEHEVKHLEWTRNAVIYEVNIRQYSPEGTFKAFEEDLPRLKELGIDIIWLMPIFPIGEVHRKADQSLLIEEVEDPLERVKYLGSYYSTKDYLSVNPEFGTSEDFKSLVDEIHKLGMYIILDIAVNHTAWDHEWIESHPEYYTRIEPGTKPWNEEWMHEHPEYFEHLENLNMTYPIHHEETDWWDVADLNFDNKDLRNEFKQIFKYWISEFDIDGYRCDAAAWVPADFWDEIRAPLDSVKPVFMLAEADIPEHHKKAFNMSYDWKLHHIFNDIAKKEKSAYSIAEHFQWVDTVYPHDSYLMQFTSNHDENSWNGTEFERMGDGAKAFAVLAATLPDMMLIYNGQESAFNRRLKFFEKDSITWGDYSYSSFYKSLISLKKRNKALRNGAEGGKLEVVSTPADSSIFAFVRMKEDDRLLVICNLSDEIQNYSLTLDEDLGTLQELFSDSPIILTSGFGLTLSPWQYLVFEN